MHFSTLLPSSLNINIFSIFPQTQTSILYRLLPAGFTYEKLPMSRMRVTIVTNDEVQPIFDAYKVVVKISNISGSKQIILK